MVWSMVIHMSLVFSNHEKDRKCVKRPRATLKIALPLASAVPLAQRYSWYTCSVAIHAGWSSVRQMDGLFKMGSTLHLNKFWYNCLIYFVTKFPTFLNTQQSWGGGGGGHLHLSTGRSTTCVPVSSNFTSNALLNYKYKHTNIDLMFCYFCLPDNTICLICHVDFSDHRDTPSHNPFRGHQCRTVSAGHKS